MIQDQHIVVFDQLKGTDLVIDRIYQGGRAGNTADDPLGKLLPVGNQGGFRTAGSSKRDAVKIAVLYTSGAEPDWPDALDPHTGVFTYFGDNRSPGRLLEDTPRNGNLLLSRVFARTHGGPTRNRFREIGHCWILYTVISQAIHMASSNLQLTCGQPRNETSTKLT